MKMHSNQPVVAVHLALAAVAAMSLGMVTSAGAADATTDAMADTTSTSMGTSNAEHIYNNSFRIGAYIVSYHSTATDVSGQYVPAGVNADIKDTQTVYLAYVRRLTPHLGLEFAAGVPPLTHTVGKGPAYLGSVPYAGQEISTARWLAPNLVLNYTFLDESNHVRPYISVGINHTSFYDRQATPAGAAALGGPTSISLSPSTGGVVGAGISGRINDHWNAIASINYAHIKTHLVADTAGVLRSSDVSFNPYALVLALGYSF